MEELFPFHSSILNQIDHCLLIDCHAKSPAWLLTEFTFCQKRALDSAIANEWTSIKH